VRFQLLVDQFFCLVMFQEFDEHEDSTSLDNLSEVSHADLGDLGGQLDIRGVNALGINHVFEEAMKERVSKQQLWLIAFEGNGLLDLSEELVDQIRLIGALASNRNKKCFHHDVALGLLQVVGQLLFKEVLKRLLNNLDKLMVTGHRVFLAR